MQVRRTTHDRRRGRLRAGQTQAASAAAAVIGALGIVACGGSSHPAKLPLSAYILRSGEQPGFHQVHRPSDYANPARFDAGSPEAAAANRRLTRAGFRRAVVVHTATSSGGAGVSNVVELGSPADARQQQAALISQARAGMSAQGPTPSRFTVPGVPGAVGVSTSVAADVAYVEGRCLLVVGDQQSSGSQRTPAVAGARAIYKRTHSHAGACSS